MPQIINFDKATYDYVDITKNGTTYHLRDDVSMDVVAPLIPLMVELDTLKGLRAGAQVDAAQVITAAMSIKDLGEQLTRIVGEIFRHTLPETTDEEIRKTFSIDERLELAQLFFGRAGSRYAQPPSATPTPTTSPKRRRRRH